jgi:hypothetical protein
MGRLGVVKNRSQPQGGWRPPGIGDQEKSNRPSTELSLTSSSLPEWYLSSGRSFPVPDPRSRPTSLPAGAEGLGRGSPREAGSNQARARLKRREWLEGCQPDRLLTALVYIPVMATPAPRRKSLSLVSPMKRTGSRQSGFPAPGPSSPSLRPPPGSHR